MQYIGTPNTNNNTTSSSSPKPTKRITSPTLSRRPKANTDGDIQRPSFDSDEGLRGRMASSAPQPAAHIHKLQDTPVTVDPSSIESQLQQIYFTVKRMLASDETSKDETRHRHRQRKRRRQSKGKVQVPRREGKVAGSRSKPRMNPRTKMK
jgi:hypothetical protein